MQAVSRLELLHYTQRYHLALLGQRYGGAWEVRQSTSATVKGPAVETAAIRVWTVRMTGKQCARRPIWLRCKRDATRSSVACARTRCDNRGGVAGCGDHPLVEALATFAYAAFARDTIFNTTDEPAAEVLHNT